MFTLNLYVLIFFMEAPLHSEVKEVSNKSKEVLITLIKNSKKIGVKKYCYSLRRSVIH